MGSPFQYQTLSLSHLRHNDLNPGILQFLHIALRRPVIRYDHIQFIDGRHIDRGPDAELAVVRQDDGLIAVLNHPAPYVPSVYRGIVRKMGLRDAIDADERFIDIEYTQILVGLEACQLQRAGHHPPSREYHCTVRHIAQGRNVPMYKTNIQTVKAGPFEGPMVCSMRPMTPENARLAYDITVKFPNVHGAPVHMGDPSVVGVADIMKPDYGEAVEIREGEIPVFWPCGVTPQAAIEAAKPPIVITHSPGHMFITDIPNAELNDYLQEKKQSK